MKAQNRNLILDGIFRNFVIGAFFVIAISDCLYAQQRDADRIYTIQKDTLNVKITEVGLQEIKYKMLLGDTATQNVIPKYKILKVVYGNGDIDDFSLWTSSQEVLPGKKYYRAIPKTPFQREIGTWSDAQLIMAKSKYKSSTVGPIIGGIVAIHLGAVLYVAGLVNTAFDDADRGTPQIIGGLVGVGGGISLTVFGAKSGRKYRAIKAEMAIRGLQDYPRATNRDVVK